MQIPKRTDNAMKKGVVLLSVILLITALSVIILKGISISENFLKQSSKSLFLSQGNKTFLDTISFLKQNTQMIKDAKSFKLIEGLPIIIDDSKNDFQIKLTLKSAANRLNINNLLKEHSRVNQNFYDFLRYILMKKEIRDANFFLSVLLDVLDKDDDERAYESEFNVREKKAVDGRINSLAQFKMILDYYVKKTQDAQIYNIEWEKIITFEEIKADYNYLNDTILFYLSEFYGINTTKKDELVNSYEELYLDEDEKKAFKDLNIEFYVPVFDCDLLLIQGEAQMNVKFHYDIPDKKVYKIETIF